MTRRSLYAFFILGLLLIVTPALAQEESATPAPAATAPAAAPAVEQAPPPSNEAVPVKIENLPETNSEAAAEATLPPLTEMPRPEMENMTIGVLRTIDKLSARTHTFDLPVDKTVKFGNSLYIKLRACRKSSPISQPESAAFLQIWERKPHEDESKWIFSGWMFASNPSLSVMDHPVYDVWLIECKSASTSAKAEKFSAETLPEKTPEKAAEDKAASESKKQGEEKTGEDAEAAPDTKSAPAEEEHVDTEASE